MPETILLTGCTGYLAKHILLRLLNAGHVVRGSLRSDTRAQEVRQAVAPHLTDPALLDNLSFVQLDLTKDEGWDSAMRDITILMHTASPFPFTQPKDENDLIRPAVDGTLRALRAAQNAGVKRVILTSSTAAISGSPGSGTKTEADWTDITASGVTPYVKSKTLAEKAAWDFVEKHPDMVLTTINPGFILGPSLDAHYGTSLLAIERILAARDPAVPRIGFTTVDVRDVADMHVGAINTPDTEGKRILSVAEFMWFTELAGAIARAFPDRKVVTRQAPNALMRVMALFDPAIRQLVPALGKRDEISNARARSIFGIDFRPVEDAVVASAQSVIAAGK
ncbi:SDR family oxidoreductase [Sulfitobacter aestuariivivens]|uniref:Aldehyde reductase n=1 Tax=Sulfitobacter aestuariivivens TaxID=2766981 RepID=A0A927HFM6_9RHOB|nr:aldehyde reductase [Sulfitobacter aestuariivivens]MBD3664598.1 aldehyde reductase [Sulfitobacter aestuariivivens]